MADRSSGAALPNAVTAFLQAVAALDALRFQLWDQDNLTITQLRLLRLLAANEGVGNSVLADGLGLTRPSVSALLTRLENAGYLVRNMDRVDRRGIVITLTDKGREATSATRGELVAASSALLSALSDAEQKSLAALLEKVVAGAEEANA